MSPQTWLNSVLYRTKPLDLDGLDSPPTTTLSKEVLYWLPRFQLTRGTVLVKLGTNKENDWMVADEDTLSRASPHLSRSFQQGMAQDHWRRNRLAPENWETLVVQEYRNESCRGYLLPRRQKSTRDLQL
jgi:hypothetical protein